MTRDTPHHDVLYKTPFEKRVVFFLVFMGILSITYGLLFVIDFLPEKPTGDIAPLETVVSNDTGTTTPSYTEMPITETTPVDPLPISIIFDSLGGKEIKVLNPESHSIPALDTALLSGVVRHPDSADFEQEGTILIFGHSSYLPKVFNKNFQAFNGIQKLVWGDIIRLRSSDIEYVYRVDREYKAKASDADIKIESGTPKLTLATCNSFGTKDDRFIVEATLVETHALEAQNPQ
jgi:LPXTG-site transpeptidase (sortase) family protein